MSLRSLVPVVARPLLASIFVVGGLDAFQNPAGKAPAAGSVLDPVLDQIPAEVEPVQVVKADGALKVVAGVTMGLGIFPRLSALALAASLVPTTLAGHRYWEHEDESVRQMQKLQLAKNASILGGLLLVAATPRRER
ncbi:DoxX family membrane protein [Luteimicrobium subarcticum]|uniref:DoxX family membrane protein n=1 Tax=Luteimicrobium subarcticum TaxID=620910 RepID=UPI0012FE2ADA|nr:DoxX family membrane protein [Luteimicrobium subarcticum]